MLFFLLEFDVILLLLNLENLELEELFKMLKIWFKLELYLLDDVIFLFYYRCLYYVIVSFMNYYYIWNDYVCIVYFFLCKVVLILNKICEINKD